jgi:gamma-glutamylcysteine synthetase
VSFSSFSSLSFRSNNYRNLTGNAAEETKEKEGASIGTELTETKFLFGTGHAKISVEEQKRFLGMVFGFRVRYFGRWKRELSVVGLFGLWDFVT